MKLFVILFAATVIFSAGQTKSLKPEEIHVAGKKIQDDLQSIYVDLKNTLDKDASLNSSAQKKVLSAMRTYYHELMKLNTEAEGHNQVSKSKLASTEQAQIALAKVFKKTPLANDQNAQLEHVISTGRSFTLNISPFATLSEVDANSPAPQNITARARRSSTSTVGSRYTINPNTNFTVSSIIPGLETAEDRIDFVERITDLNAAFSRQLTNARFNNNGNIFINPPVYPAAYIYTNGYPGNFSGFGRRDSLRPVYINRRPVQPRRTAPLIQINIR